MKNSDKPDCGDFGGHNKQGEPCGHPAGWGTDFDDGKCKKHRGTSPDGKSHEKNLNAMKHGAYASPEFIQAGIENGHPKLEEYQDMYHAFFEALCTQHEEVYGREPNDFFKSRYRRFVTFDIMERLIEDYLDERQGSAESENPLVERQIEDIDGAMNVEKANKLLQRLSEWSREIRLGMKDYGLLYDPETKMADANRELGEVVAEALEPQD